MLRKKSATSERYIAEVRQYLIALHLRDSPTHILRRPSSSRISDNPTELRKLPLYHANEILTVRAYHESHNLYPIMRL